MFEYSRPQLPSAWPVLIFGLLAGWNFVTGSIEMADGNYWWGFACLLAAGGTLATGASRVGAISRMRGL